METNIYQKVHNGIGFEIEKINGMWTIYYDDDNIDEAIFNWYRDHDRTHVLKSVAIDKAEQYIETL